MAYYLATADDQVRSGWVKRFRPELWTIDFPRPMMAALTVPEPGTIRVDLDFLTRNDLAGLIWASEDLWSHPLLAYRTERDYRGVVLSFDWLSGPGVMPLDAVNGPVLTIEGRDEGGAPHTWYVRLWNYASGTPTAAHIRLEMAALRAGFAASGEPVFAGDIDRLFLSLVPSGFDGSNVTLPASSSGYVELRNIEASGPGSTIAIGDAFLSEHGFRICSGYDDSYHQSPERLVEQWQAMGFRGLVTHYVGMSHFPQLQAAGGAYKASSGVCASALAWHRAFLKAIARAGMQAVLSFSLELLDLYAPDDWAQRDADGAPALTGWDPPSTLLSPCNATAVAWLATAAGQMMALAADEQGEVLFQLGEPWWWVGASGAPCFYDAATVARWQSEKGHAPPILRDVEGTRSAAEQEWLDWLGERLADASATVRDAARSAAGSKPFRSYLLFYTPQVLKDGAPDLRRANMPERWASPFWDVLQLEDYEYVTDGNARGHAQALAVAADVLRYPLAARQYFAGFVQQPEDAEEAWERIDQAADELARAGWPAVFFWAWPQVARDGFTKVAEGQPGMEGKTDVDGFHDVRFPLALGFDASGGPEYSTQIAELASGHEQRNLLWAEGRLRYDAGLGVRSEADLALLLRFFRARRGQAFAFRFRDPMDWSSSDTGGEPGPLDQYLGRGDGQTMRFQLVKRYGEPGAEEVRRISRPVASTVRVATAGAEKTTGWHLSDMGIIEFDEPPAAGIDVQAGYAFDVPVRFAVDRIDISLSSVHAGEIPSVPMVEVRE